MFVHSSDYRRHRAIGGDTLICSRASVQAGIIDPGYNASGERRLPWRMDEMYLAAHEI